MGPEKFVLLQKQLQFQELNKAEERQEIWYHLYKWICADSFSKDYIDHLQVMDEYLSSCIPKLICDTILCIHSYMSRPMSLAMNIFPKAFLSYCCFELILMPYSGQNDL